MKNQTIKQFSLPIIFLTNLLLMFGAAVYAQPYQTSVFFTGLEQPSKIIQTPLDNLAVTETPAAPNSGRISIIDRYGTRRTLIEGLPSAVSAEGPSGPTGLEMRGRTMFVAIGQGDSVLPGPINGTQIPNPNPTSPLFSSVLIINFSAKVETYGQGFSLSLANQNILANGGTVVLRNGNIDSITIRMLANFPDYKSEPLPFFSGNVRHSNPFAIADGGDNLYVADGGMNSVFKVNILSGEWRTLVTFPPRPNPLPFGPPVIEAVPDGIRAEGSQLLVTLLTGFPFVPGLSEVRQVDTRTGANSTFIPGRSSAIDVLRESRQENDTPQNTRLAPLRQPRHFVLEFSTNFLANEPGQLLAFDSPYYPEVIARGLISPSGMMQDRQSGDIFITEIFTGRIIRVHMPR